MALFDKSCLAGQVRTKSPEGSAEALTILELRLSEKLGLLFPGGKMLYVAALVRSICCHILSSLGPNFPFIFYDKIASTNIFQ